MDIINHPHFYQWLTLGVTLLILTYAAFKIKNEPEQYDKTSVQRKLGKYLLKVPSWWGLTSESESKLQFERTDTRYEWAVTFETINAEISNPEEQLKNLVADLGVKFDLGFDSEKIELDRVCIYRHEGMSTENEIKRVYMDIAIVTIKDSDQYMEVISRSSILNGCVEGPYVEKVLQNIEEA